MRPFPALLLALLTAPALAVEKPAPIAWGPAVDGLQAGLLFGGGRTHWQIGEDAPLRVHLRNTTRTPLKLVYFKPALLGWVPEVRDPRGRLAPVESPPLDYPVQRAELSLRPGETVLLGDSRLAFRRPNGPAGEGVLVSTMRAEPGRYRVSFPYRFQGEGEGTWTGALNTGAVSLTLAPETNRKVARQEPSGGRRTAE
jgi:hypothetical protein